MDASIICSLARKICPENAAAKISGATKNARRHEQAYSYKSFGQAFSKACAAEGA
jgi:hypothetical protein